MGGWILIHFHQDENGKCRKLPKPWYEPYCITSHNDPDVTAAEHLILHYKSTNQELPDIRRLPNDFYCYGGKRSKPGRPTKRFQKQLDVTNAHMKNQVKVPQVRREMIKKTQQNLKMTWKADGI